MFIVMGSLWCWSVNAQENRLLDKFNIHGSVSVGYLETTNGNNLMRTETSDGTWRFHEILLNSSYNITDTLLVRAQLISRVYLEFGNNNPQLDWGFIQYQPVDWVGARLGRVKNAPGLYGDIWDVDVARVTPLMPMSTYNNALRDFMISADGVQLFGNVELGSLGSIEYQAAAGYKKGADEDTGMEYYFEVNSSQRTEYDDGIRARIYGASLKWETPLDGLRLVGSFIQARDPNADLTAVKDYTIMLTVMPGVTIPYTVYSAGDTLAVDGVSISFTNIGAEYLYEDWGFSLEYFGARVKDFTVTHKQSNTVLETVGYISGGYNLQVTRTMGENLQLAAGFGQYFTDWTERFDIDASARDGSGKAARQDIYLAAKYNITDALFVKVGVHSLRGKFELSTDANSRYGVYDADPRYWLYAFKLTYTF
ncbi:MAG: hypothetical protein D6820_04270 [Lentisphaerae bacterium]|nr:MAG: hypothetical protein D6820_04270 [Lentisphaerota bacterium]